jgi:hypothetical protein
MLSSNGVSGRSWGISLNIYGKLARKKPGYFNAKGSVRLSNTSLKKPGYFNAKGSISLSSTVINDYKERLNVFFLL